MAGVDVKPFAVRRLRELGLGTEFGDATDLSLSRAGWIVSTVSIHPTGLSHEDMRTTLIEMTRTAEEKKHRVPAIETEEKQAY